MCNNEEIVFRMRKSKLQMRTQIQAVVIRNGDGRKAILVIKFGDGGVASCYEYWD